MLYPSIVSEIARDAAGYLSSGCGDCTVEVSHVEPIGLFCGAGCCRAFVVPLLKVNDDPGCTPTFSLELKLLVDICGPEVTEQSVYFNPDSIDAHLAKLTILLAQFNEWSSQKHLLPGGGDMDCNSVTSRSGWVLSRESTPSCYRFVSSIIIRL
jgi:hypothetical protein